MLDIRSCVPLDSQDMPLASPVSFICPPKQAVWLQGLNGSGKTVMMRSLSGYMAHLGDIRVDGSVVSMYDRSRFICMPDVDWQALRFWWAMDLIKYMGLPVGQLSAHIENYVRHKRVGQLSCGQRQLIRCVMLTSAHHRVWCLDEIDSHLDSRARALLVDLCHAFMHSGGMIVYASHQGLELDAGSVNVCDMLSGRNDAVIDKTC